MLACVCKQATDSCFTPLLMLTGDIKKAREAGFHTVMSFIIHPTKVGSCGTQIGTQIVELKAVPQEMCELAI